MAVGVTAEKLLLQVETIFLSQIKQREEMHIKKNIAMTSEV